MTNKINNHTHQQDKIETRLDIDKNSSNILIPNQDTTKERETRPADEEIIEEVLEIKKEYWGSESHYRANLIKKALALKTKKEDYFLEKLRGEVNKNGARNVVKDIRGNCSAGYGIEYRILFKIINELSSEFGIGSRK